MMQLYLNLLCKNVVVMTNILRPILDKTFAITLIYYLKKKKKKQNVVPKCHLRT